MICKKCGNNITEGASSCPICGADTASQQQGTNQTLNGNPYASAQSNPIYPMKWYKFLIYFSLFASAVLFLYNAISFITGMQYQQDKDAVYATFRSLQAVDVIYGIVCLLLGCYAIYVRQRLAHFCENGPKHLIGLYTVSLATSILYAICSTSIVNAAMDYSGREVSMLNSQMITSLIVAVVMIFANMSYFKKRKALFTH